MRRFRDRLSGAALFRRKSMPEPPASERSADVADGKSESPSSASSAEPEEAFEDAEDAELYADVPSTPVHQAAPAEEADSYEYDVPRISFSFLESLNGGPAKCRSELKIVLAAPQEAAPEEEPGEPTLVSMVKYGSDSNINSRREDGEELYKVPVSVRAHSLDLLRDDDTPEMPATSPASSVDHISCSQVLATPNDAGTYDYCKTRSRLPIRLRRASLLRSPQMKVKAAEHWDFFRSKLSGIIANHAAAQRVGANSDQRIAINLEQICKSSKKKYQKFFRSTGKLFQRKRSADEGSAAASADLKGVHIGDISGPISVPSEELNGLELPQRKDRGIDFDTIGFRDTIRRSRYFPEGQTGFDELRKYVKQGGDFCKELAAILQERSEVELQYAKSLSKLSSKLNKACRDGSGGLIEAWKAVANEMEIYAEVHRQFGGSLNDDVSKPLKTLWENQHKVRKQIEGSVDKTGRMLAEWRAAEAKAKKQSHSCARDNEKLQDAMLDVRLPRSTSLIQLSHLHNHKPATEKETAKLEGKKRKAEDAVKKADIDYYTHCVRAERARLEWESAVLRGANTFQSLEDEKLNQFKMLLLAYFKCINEMGPKLMESTERLRRPISDSEPTKDLAIYTNLRQSVQYNSEQLLPDFYCEHTTLAMNRKRREQALTKILHLIRQDLEREKKSKSGLESLSKAMKQTPNFGGEDSQQNVMEKLHHMRSMLTYLEGSRYKVQSALAEMDDRQRTDHPLAAHITVTRDKSGLQHSTLRVPRWLNDDFIEKTEIVETESDWLDRGMGDGNSNQHDSDFDEFSSEEGSTASGNDQETILEPVGHYKAVYAYNAQLADELTIQPGDLLKVYRKQADGWWLGEANGSVGIFPATYVEPV